MTDTNHYETLEVRDFASAEVVRGAYKHLSQRWHPDKNPGDTARASTMTTAINAAYFVLSDPGRRLSFDNELRARQGRQSSSNSPPPKDQTGPSNRETSPPPWSPPQQNRPFAEKVRPAERPPGRARFYLYLYALGFAVYGGFHFDLAGAGWGGAVIVIAALGMLIGAYRPTNEGGVRVLFATGIVCVLVAFYGRLNPAEPSVEPAATVSAPPAVAIDAPPAAASSASSESVDQTSTAGTDDPTPSSQDPAPLPRDALPAEAPITQADDGSGASEPKDEPSPPAQEAVARPAQVTFAPLRYPPQAVRLRHEGTVTLEVAVGASGSVAGMKVAQSSGWPELDREAERSRPVVVISAYQDGNPVDSVVRIPVTFSLNK